jgi:UDP-glucuronate 4-epimerase
VERLTLITGAAGFIGFHCARELLARGESVVGIDNLNTYYAVELKRARLAELRRHRKFQFHQVDIADAVALESALSGVGITRVLHLAAQAGVRYSLENPHAYASSNLVGHLNVLELCRHRADVEHLVYASSSSVYGHGSKMPYAETERADRPASLYAATKRADELMSEAYASLYDIRQSGLRYFTVYGPWGRPDMAVWLFTDAILRGREIKLFDGGHGRRDFTYIDDTVAGTLAVLDRAPSYGAAPHRIYNVANGNPVTVIELLRAVEEATGLKARTVAAPKQAGDVDHTAADISAIVRDFGFAPKTPIAKGVAGFVDWYRKQYPEIANPPLARVGT